MLKDVIRAYSKFKFKFMFKLASWQVLFYFTHLYYTINILFAIALESLPTQFFPTYTTSAYLVVSTY